MNAKSVKVKKPEKLTVRDFVTLAIMIVLHFLVHTLTTPLGMTAVGNLFVYTMDGVALGTAYMLMCTRVNKKKAVLVYGLGVSIILMMNAWMSGLVTAIGAVIVEIVWEKLDRKKLSTITICYMIQILFLHIGAIVPLVLFKDLYLESIPAYAELYSAVYEAATSYLFFVALLTTIIASIVGAMIGKMILRKHFEKAGIVA